MDLTLYRAVGNQNRVALGNLATSEFYVADKDETTGRITLVPVNIVGGQTKAAATQADQDDDSDTPE